MATLDEMKRDAEMADTLLAESEAQTGFVLGGPLASCPSHVRELAAEVERLRAEVAAMTDQAIMKFGADQWMYRPTGRVHVTRGDAVAQHRKACGLSAAGAGVAGGEGGEKS